MNKKETLKFTNYFRYNSNAEIFTEDINGESRFFSVSYDAISTRAKRAGGEALKRAVIRLLKELNPDYRFINKNKIY